MGRKSKPRRGSNSSSSHLIVNIYKNKKMRRNIKNKTKQNFKKLFNTLRDDISNSYNSLNNTIIEVDKTITKTDRNAKNVNNKPSSSSFIVIDDDDLITNNDPSPIHCSTPINNKQIFNKRTTSQSKINNTSSKPQKFFEEIQDLAKEINRGSHFKNLSITPCNESDVSNSFNSLNNTIIEVEVDNTNSKTNKCAKILNNKPSSSSSSSLIIIDDEPCPVQTSTPINTQAIFNDRISSPNKVNDNSTPQNLYDNVENLLSKTKEINRDSYLTIDLTTDSGLNATKESNFNTVIDLVNSSEVQDCIVSNDSLSMSGDSDVTVINTKRKLNNEQMKKFLNGIAHLDSHERGDLLQYIANKLFRGCNGPNSSSNSLQNVKTGTSILTETAEDTYIKEVILGRPSRNSIGSNIYNPERDRKNRTGLRMIVIDGSNVAMQHTKGRVFSVKGLKICIEYFVHRGHVVRAFVPHFRCKNGKSTDGRLLDQLERQGLVFYTPSREVQGRMITSYDDRYIVQCAAEFDAVIVSGDNYRDLLVENPKWRQVIENRLLQFTWVGDMIMFPRDPLGRNGPTLDQFLKHPQ